VVLSTSYFTLQVVSPHSTLLANLNTASASFRPHV